MEPSVLPEQTPFGHSEQRGLVLLKMHLSFGGRSIYIVVSDFVFRLVSSIEHFVAHFCDLGPCAQMCLVPQLKHCHRKPAKEVAVHL